MPATYRRADTDRDQLAVRLHGRVPDLARGPSPYGCDSRSVRVIRIVGVAELCAPHRLRPPTHDRHLGRGASLADESEQCRIDPVRTAARVPRFVQSGGCPVRRGNLRAAAVLG